VLHHQPVRVVQLTQTNVVRLIQLLLIHRYEDGLVLRRVGGPVSGLSRRDCPCIDQGLVLTFNLGVKGQALSISSRTNHVVTHGPYRTSPPPYSPTLSTPSPHSPSRSSPHPPYLSPPH
jgi:hypothetical protein